MQELLTSAPTGLTLDAYLYAISGDMIWNTSSLVFETPISSHWANYKITLTESSGTYHGDFPTDIIAAGTYPYNVRIRAGVSASPTDGVYAAGLVKWDGSQQIINTGGNVTTKSFVKIQNGWTDTSHDDFIDQTLPVVTSAIEKFLRRKIMNATFTEIRNGQGTDYIKVYNPPINSITQITFDYNDYIPKVVTSSSFIYDTNDNVGLIKFKPTAPLKYSFGEGFQNISIVYSGGWIDIPANIQAAAALIIRKLLEMSDDDRLVTEKVEGSRKIRYDQTYVMGALELPVFAEAKQLLLPFVLTRIY